MNQSDFLQAMTILTLGHSNKVEINRVAGETVTENKENVRLEIISCTPATVNRLKTAGFSLGMKDGRMTVDKY